MGPNPFCIFGYNCPFPSVTQPAVRHKVDGHTVFGVVEPFLFPHNGLMFKTCLPTGKIRQKITGGMRPVIFYLHTLWDTTLSPKMFAYPFALPRWSNFIDRRERDCDHHQIRSIRPYPYIIVYLTYRPTDVAKCSVLDWFPMFQVHVLNTIPFPIFFGLFSVLLFSIECSLPDVCRLWCILPFYNPELFCLTSLSLKP